MVVAWTRRVMEEEWSNRNGFEKYPDIIVNETSTVYLQLQIIGGKL